MGCGAGPGFYFALQASKSHDYPLGEMQALPPGMHSRSMLLGKVAKGKVFRSERHMDPLTPPPHGFHSVLGGAPGQLSPIHISRCRRRLRCGSRRPAAR